MASGGVEERDEIGKLIIKTNTDRLRDEVMKNTSKTEIEISRMSRNKLMACMVYVWRKKEAGTWVGTTKSVRGTPTGSPGMISDRI